MISPIISRHIVGIVGILFLTCFNFGWAKNAEAQDSNYQDFILGERAMGMGGAFTALSNDPSAAFYNPAGLAMMSRYQISLSLTIYGLEYRAKSKGVRRPEGTIDLDTLRLAVIPTTAGVATKFGSKDRFGRREWATGITVMVPSRYIVYFREGFQINNSNNLYLLHREDQTFWAGPSIARRFGSFAIGISGLYVHRDFSWLLTQTGTTQTCIGTTKPICTVNEADGLVSSIEGWVGNLTFRLGLMYEFSTKWRIGLMFGLSSFRLWGEGSLLLQRFVLSRQNKGESPNQYVEQRHLVTNSTLPWEIRLGSAAKVSPRLLLSFDLAFYAPNSYTLLEVEFSKDTQKKDLELFQYPRKIDRNMVLNFHLGAEYSLTSHVPLRLGFFTNFSSSSDDVRLKCSDQACLPQIQMLGITASIGLEVGHQVLDFGFNASYGYGTAQRIYHQEGLRFEPVSKQHLFLYLYLSGLTQVLEYGVNELVKQFGVLSSSILKQKFLQKKPSHHQPSQQNKKGKNKGVSKNKKKRKHLKHSSS